MKNKNPTTTGRHACTSVFKRQLSFLLRHFELWLCNIQTSHLSDGPAMKDMLFSVCLLLLTTHTCLAEEEETRSLPPLTDGPAQTRSLHLKLPPVISLRLLAISAASPLPRHSSLSFHCQFAPPWAFFGTLCFVSSIRLGWPNFILYRIPLVWIHTDTHTNWEPETSAHMSLSSQAAGGWPAPSKDQIHHQLHDNSISSGLNSLIFAHHRN